MRAIVAAAVLAVVVACIGCDQPPPATGPAATIIPIATQPPTAGGLQACMAALLEGTLVRDPRTGIGIAGADGGVVPVRWPNGWLALEMVPVVLVDASGRVVARVGDHVAIGGGMPDQIWEACATDIKVVP